MKKEQKEKFIKGFDTFFVSMVFGILLLFITYEMNNNHKEIVNEVKELKILIQQRAVKDTLYWEHLENCAFELKQERS